MLFVITNGQSTVDIKDSTIASLKHLNVNRYAIGIGRQIRELVLRRISGDSDTDDSRVYNVDNYELLKEVFFTLSVATCSSPSIITTDVDELTDEFKG